MTPFAKYILLALMAFLVMVLIIRMGLRWWRDRKGLKALTRPQSPPSGEQQASASQTVTSPTKEATDKPVPEPARSTIQPAVRIKSYKNRPASSAASTTSSAKKTTPQSIEADALPFADTSDYSYGPLTPLLASLLPESEPKKNHLKRVLKNAGYYTPHAWHNLAATRYLGIIIPLLAFGLILVFLPQQFEWLAISGLILGPLLGYSLPSLLVQSQATSRLKEIEQGMPDMLDMLNMCVSQGMMLPRAMERVGQELRGVYPALSQELSIVSDQARIGGVQQALARFAERVDLPDVHSFTSLMIQTERMGTSVSDALADYSDNMRESLKQTADQKANSATFKLLFPTVLCLMPAVFLFLLGPAIVELHQFFSGGLADSIRVSADTAQQALQQ